MSKRLLAGFLALAIILPTFGLVGFVQAESEANSTAAATVCSQENKPVCGVDNKTYANACEAEAAGVDVSYDFACVNPTSEKGLYEAKSDIHFVGQLIEIGSTDIPTTIIVRPNGQDHDYTINITADTILGQRRGQTTNLSDWIPGDQIRVIGTKNENTEVIDATILVNLSIAIRRNRGANGWITKIDKEAKTITYQWMNKEHTFAYDDNTRFVAGLKNPATVDDLKIGDRIRARLLLRRGDMPLAKIVVVLRRGSTLFMKIRTFTPRATLVRIDSTIVPTTIQVKIERTPGLKANDVNNLIGTEGALVTVNVTENTKIVRKYFGRTTLAELSVGDSLMIVGRVNDDGTVDAKLIKDNSIWKTSLRGRAGVVVGVDVEHSYLKVKWTPIRRLTRKKIKEKLSQASAQTSSTVSAQMIPTTLTKTQSQNSERITAKKVKLHLLSNRLRQKIRKITARKVGKFLRRVKYKKIRINRIKHPNLKIGDLIQRLKPRIIRVDITPETKIVVGTNNNASISDIQVGDKVRIRGTKHAKLPIVVADTVVVVNSLPEIEENLTEPLDEVNEITAEITTDKTDEAIVPDTSSDTEPEIETETSSEDNSSGAAGSSSSAEDNQSQARRFGHSY